MPWSQACAISANSGVASSGRPELTARAPLRIKALLPWAIVSKQAAGAINAGWLNSASHRRCAPARSNAAPACRIQANAHAWYWGKPRACSAGKSRVNRSPNRRRGFDAGRRSKWRGCIGVRCWNPADFRPWIQVGAVCTRGWNCGFHCAGAECCDCSFVDQRAAY